MSLPGADAAALVGAMLGNLVQHSFQTQVIIKIGPVQTNAAPNKLKVISFGLGRFL